MATRTLALAALIGLASLASPALAQEAPITSMEAPPEPTAIALGTGGGAGSTAPESWFHQYGDTFVRNVSTATLTPFLPAPGKATGAAVIVAPGGGFMFLSMSNEGWEVARALADRGVAAFVLKYRVRPTPSDLDAFAESMNAMFSAASSPPRATAAAAPAAQAPVNPFVEQVEDAEAAFALVRSRSAEWGVDPDRIGMVGFSAGAATTMATALYSPTAHPAFIGSIYGGMDAVQVPANAPPLFVALAADDPLFGNRGFGLIQSWEAAGKPVELHFYQNGGHGFGLGNPGKTSLGWFDVFMNWVALNGFLQSNP